MTDEHPLEDAMIGLAEELARTHHDLGTAAGTDEGKSWRRDVPT